ncbi:hypothetical protein B0H13DRAFT_2372716 [Mycena leptocephala]|nr:hypothetical protein B0H13DRAFT_2372716 [Mycena leptocephala]
MFRQFFSLGALFALLVFISSGPKHLASKAEYEVATHKTAVELLKERLGEDGLAALLRMIEIPDKDIVSTSPPTWNDSRPLWLNRFGYTHLQSSSSSHPTPSFI